MSAEQQNAVLQEVLDQSYIYRQQAALRNGLPDRPVRNLIDKAKAALAPPVQQAAQQASGFVKPLVLGAALVSGGAGLAYLAGDRVATNANNATNIQLPEDAAPEPKSGSLLRWLRDNGYNLPPTATE